MSNISSTSSIYDDENYLTFLKLLTTQLQNQDPTNPLDTNGFTSQLIQFSQIEQQIKTNDSLSQLLNVMDQQTYLQSLNYIDKYITYYNSDVTIDDNTDNVKLSYDMPESTDKIEIKIYNNLNDEVKNIIINEPISNKYEWDLTDNDGNRVDNGEYKIEISSHSKDESYSLAPLQTDMVTSVYYDNSNTILKTGNEYVTISDIISVDNSY